MTLQDRSPDGLQMTLRTLRWPHGLTYTENKALFDVLLTIGELNNDPSKDWIRPPSPSQECVNSLIYYRFYIGYIPRS